MKCNTIKKNPYRRGVRTLQIILFCMIVGTYTGGCNPTMKYDGDESRKWIIEQVEKGNMTQEEADKLLQELYPDKEGEDGNCK